MNQIEIHSIIQENMDLARGLALEKRVSPELNEQDMLLDFLIRYVFPHDPSLAVSAYFNGGEDCAKRFTALCKECYPDEPKSVLEFASGYGRVTRHIKNFLATTEWSCADIHPEAVSFINDELGILSFLSHSNPTDWKTTRTYDIVFALSFFSHIPDHTFSDWIASLLSSVTPGGSIIFTTHGATSLSNMGAEFDSRGYYWNSNSDQRDLDPSDYGTSAVSLGFVENVISTIDQAEIIRFQQAYWWQHQDLYVVRKKSC